MDRIVAEITSDVLAPAGHMPVNKVKSTAVPTSSVVLEEVRRICVLIATFKIIHVRCCTGPI